MHSRSLIYKKRLKLRARLVFIIRLLRLCKSSNEHGILVCKITKKIEINKEFVDFSFHISIEKICEQRDLYKKILLRPSTLAS